MDGAAIKIYYDGGDADQHSIDARLFGRSLQGIDKLVSDPIIIFTQERLPKKRERAPLYLKVKEPHAGSFATLGYFQEAAFLLPLGIPLLSQVGTDLVSYYVTAALDFFRGRNREMELAIEKMAEMHQHAVAANDRADERRHVEAMGMQDIIRQSIMSNSGAATNYVAPIGPSVTSAAFSSGEAKPVIIDAAAADEIRDYNKLDWTKISNLALKTDGFKFHTNGLSVENPEREGFLMAEVNDPAFEEESNAYTEAAQKRAKIEVMARKGYRDETLVKIQIVQFVREINDYT